MKVLAINGSPRKGGNTELMIQEVFKTLEKHGIETEVFQLGGKKVNGCTACNKCREKADGKCHIQNDIINQCIEKMREADGIILGSPVYFSDMTPEMKALIDVSGYALRGCGNSLRRKAGAAVAVARRAGGTNTFVNMNQFFLIMEMIIPGSSYWNVGYGKDKGDVLKDDEALKTMHTLGENMAWLLCKTKN
ncbi:flavodoxin family protein [Natronoflexus pectinivorans]|uniref:Multimeric flavodoxin WrbA n=1 Tax=Natronoflexus pectinivorans TaxID=682526 RepID=A0A4V6NMQ2_9BACT|nr:flavodoxin family protein [Natronoflexus pectinivorans]TCO07914.1 multimeric flavodoxin WrbA [Natronoflexus pectinivorans]